MKIVSSYTKDNKYIRFNHKERSWQRMGAFGWYNILTSVARALRDQNFKIWGEE